MDVADVLPGYADAFDFETFNRMQTATLPTVLGSDANVVVSAPTASGKTAIAEAAISKTLEAGGTALFIAPMRALTTERETEWAGFEELGYSVYVVTGDRELTPRRARRADILVMTPEKVDSASRKYESRRYGFITDVDLCVLDEVHLLDSPRRGSALEVIVSRLRRLAEPRFIALSATMPNVEDIAEWLDAPPEATFEFDEDYRPVELTAGVKTYVHGENAFADKYRRLYRALDLVEPHLDADGQALVFVSSRQDTVEAARTARDELAERDLDVGDRGNYAFHEQTTALDNETLRKSVLDGVAFHHAGLSASDRSHIEEWFRAGQIDLLFSTSTLAWGVNLPARCVVIRDTKYHDPLDGEVEMSPLDVLQMLGRAGRPGYDDVGYGWVITDRADADHYRQLLTEGTDIESHLLSDLGEHLVAEVTLGTIDDLDAVMDWFETTYGYVRAQRSAAMPDLTSVEELLRETLSELVADGFIETGEDLSVGPTPLGRLTSVYYLRLATARQFHTALQEGVSDNQAVLRAIATATEFDDVNARTDEQDAIEAVLGDRGDDLDPGHRKVLAILRAGMVGTVPTDLQSDAWVIKRNAQRLLAALHAFSDAFATPAVANLIRRVEARLEHGLSDTAAGLTAIDGVGATRANTLVEAGIETPAAVATAEPATLSAAGLDDGVCDRIKQAAANLPAIDIEWGAFPERIPDGENTIHEVTIRNTGGGGNVGITVTVNGVEMTHKETYLSPASTVSVPVGVYGSDVTELTYTVTVVLPDEPLEPIETTRTVQVV